MTQTNADIMHRMKQAEEITHGLYNLIIKEIATQVCEESDVMIFNSRIKPYSGLVDVVVFSKHQSVALKYGDEEIACELVNRETLDGGMVIEVTKDGEKEVPVPPYYRFELKAQVKDLPALGYRTFSVVEKDELPAVKTVAEQFIENDHYRLNFAEGELTLVSRKDGRIISDLLRFENVADDGDSYDFSPLKGDTPIFSDRLELMDCQHGKTVQSIRLRSVIKVPANLDSRKMGENDAEISFILKLTLQAGKQTSKWKLPLKTR